MTNLKDFITKLRHKPYETRIRVLWSTTAVLGIILLVLWGYTLKSEIGNLNGTQLLDLPNLDLSQDTPPKFIKVERIEETATVLKIFFSVNNDSADILNFSSVEEIELSANNTTYQPVQVLDRQNKPFVVKVLSHTENFGTLVFPPVNSDLASITFKDLHFEKQPETIFQETLKLEVAKLKKDAQLRN